MGFSHCRKYVAANVIGRKLLTHLVSAAAELKARVYKVEILLISIMNDHWVLRNLTGTSSYKKL